MTLPLQGNRCGLVMDYNHFKVDTAVRVAIGDEMCGIEKRHGVRVLYASETGSRGWGFASTDSDYDVRFVYAHTKDWYLDSLLSKADDTIENAVQQTSIGKLDICGWDLVKAIDLFRNSNASIFEWLTSPIVYQETTT